MGVRPNTHNRRVRKRRLVQELEKVDRSEKWGDGEVNLADQFLELCWIVENGIAFEGDIGSARMIR